MNDKETPFKIQYKIIKKNVENRIVIKTSRTLCQKRNEILTVVFKKILISNKIFWMINLTCFILKILFSQFFQILVNTESDSIKLFF